ncbi:LPD1 domain-containing protein [Vibrio hannami]|uniref:LPD1 domain-containing protein n=1 Tax=Vibrio hannami TaxID=2717094 RepID=UPI003BB1D05A
MLSSRASSRRRNTGRKYFKSSKAYDEMVSAGGYYTNPAEMFARAFEAYVGTKGCLDLGRAPSVSLEGRVVLQG